MYNKTYSRSTFNHNFHIYSFITSKEAMMTILHVKYDYGALIGNDNAWEICHFINLHLRNIRIIALDTRASILHTTHMCVQSKHYTLMSVAAVISLQNYFFFTPFVVVTECKCANNHKRDKNCAHSNNIYSFFCLLFSPSPHQERISIVSCLWLRRQ
jgi:hypothetical protein